MWSVKLHNSILTFEHTTTELRGIARVIGTTHEIIHIAAATPKQRSVPTSDISEHRALQQVMQLMVHWATVAPRAAAAVVI